MIGHFKKHASGVAEPPGKHASGVGQCGKHALPPAGARLDQIGRALAGPFWLPAVGREIGMSPVPLGMFRRGERPVPSTLWGKLQPLLHRKACFLAELRPRWDGKHALLAEVGHALYGHRWASCMADDLIAADTALAVSARPGWGERALDKSLSRMANGAQAIPPTLREAVSALIARRMAEAAALAERRE